MLGLKPIEKYEKSPDWIDRVDGVETPERVDLEDLPVGTTVQFYGLHPDSIYICLVDGCEESGKTIKIWLKGRGNGAVGDLDAIVSEDLASGGSPEGGVMQVGMYYSLPTFIYDKDKNLALQFGMQIRTEPYTRIFLLRPDQD